MDNVMTVSHPKWSEFIERLEGPEGCDFQEGVNPPETVSWKCDLKNERPLARKLLADYDVDIEASLAYFDKNGGHCDCEICFNVEDSAEWED